MPHLFGGLSLWERWHAKGVTERATLEKKQKTPFRIRTKRRGTT